MKCKVCNKEIDIIIERPKVDTKGIELLSEGARSLLENEINKTYLNGIHSKSLLEVCSNECFNKKLYELLNDDMKNYMNLIKCEELLGTSDLMRMPRTEEQYKNIEDMISFAKTKLENYK